MTQDPTLHALLLTLDFPPTRGGIQTMAREFCARASRTDLRVIAPADPGFVAVDASIGIPVERVRAIAPGRRGFVPSLARAARRQIKRERPDVVLAMHPLAAPGGLLSRVPTVVVTHGGELRSSRIARVARLVLPRAERVVANSRYTRTAAIALGADPLKTVVLPVGAPDPVAVAPEAAAEVKERFGGRIVLTVARLAPHKGIDRLIAALPALPDDVHLVVVGEGSARGVLTEQVRMLGLRDRVHLLGAVGEDELAQIFTAADVFALLSLELGGAHAGVEGGGIALLEACAYGLPVLAAATGGIPETIRDDENGLLVDPDDGAAVERGLRRLLDDAPLAERLADAGRAMATGERSWTRFTERLEAVLELAARRSGEVVP